MSQHIIIATRTRSAEIYYFSGYLDHFDGWDRIWTKDPFRASRFDADEAETELLLLADASDISDLASMQTFQWITIPRKA